MASASCQTLLAAVSDWRKRGKFTDLVLQHENETFGVHRIVVCPQSEFLHKACTGGFKEQSTGIINMKHIPIQYLKYMVEFFYTLDYGLDDSNISLATHVQMFTLADQYDVPKLSELVTSKFKSQCTASWSAEHFLNCIEEIYESTPDSVRTLRDLACEIAQAHLPEMLDDEKISTLYDRVQDDVPAFTKDLLKAYVLHPKNLHEKKCVRCKRGEDSVAVEARCKDCVAELSWFSEGLGLSVCPG